jgi:hypothetical protein
METKQFSVFSEHETIYLTRNNFGVNLLYICNNYKPGGGNFDQHRCNDMFINGKHYSVFIRTFY